MSVGTDAVSVALAVSVGADVGSGLAVGVDGGDGVIVSVADDDAVGVEVEVDVVVLGTVGDGEGVDEGRAEDVIPICACALRDSGKLKIGQSCIRPDPSI